MVYENLVFCRTNISRKDGRVRCYLKFNDGTHKSMSYPKYLMECHLGRYLTDEETVDHIDQNPQNNDLSNLRVMTRSNHCSKDSKKCVPVVLTCALCGKQFEHTGSLNYRNRSKKKCKGFYFCSRHCAGVWNQQIQVGKRKIECKEEVKSDYYTEHSFE